MKKPEFSVALPSCSEGLCYPVPYSNLDVILRMAKQAEELGYHSVWPNDHLTTQKYVREKWASPPNYYDPFICLAYAAHVTKRIRLGTAITVIPVREPTVLAKQVMTLDNFSGGRVILGVGIGAYREEFEQVQPRLAAYARRGDMLTEGIQALRTLFTQHHSAHTGIYWEFRDVEMYPKPVQDPLPIWVGGNSRESALRAARLGEGWLPAGGMSPETIGQFVALIHEEADKAGRGDREIEIAPQFAVQIGRTDEEAVEAYRRSWMFKHIESLKDSSFKDQDLSHVEEYDLVGSPATILEKVARFHEAGVTHFCGLTFSANTVEETLDQTQWFAEEIVARV